PEVEVLLDVEVRVVAVAVPTLIAVLVGDEEAPVRLDLGRLEEIRDLAAQRFGVALVAGEQNRVAHAHPDAAHVVVPGGLARIEVPAEGAPVPLPVPLPADRPVQADVRGNVAAVLHDPVAPRPRVLEEPVP